MKRTELPTFHAIYAVAGELELLKASIASIYDFVEGITIVSGSDRDWMGQPRESSRVHTLVHSPTIDPDRKISLLITDETNEARSRNRAMDFASPSGRSTHTVKQSPRDHQLRRPDYFLIVDADEIWEADQLTNLRTFIAAHPAHTYRAACLRYFKRWNYRIDGFEWATVAVTASTRFRYLRLPPTLRIRRWFNRLQWIPPRLRQSICGFIDIDPAVTSFHHGSYVGPTARITEKLASFGHSHEVAPDWMERVWNRFDPSMTNLNPVYPSLFPGTTKIPTSELPQEIKSFPWPDEYTD